MKWTPGYLEWRNKYIAAYKKKYVHGYSTNSYTLRSIFTALPDEEFSKAKEEALSGVAYEVLNPDESDGDFKRTYILLLNIEIERKRGRK